MTPDFIDKKTLLTECFDSIEGLGDSSQRASDAWLAEERQRPIDDAPGFGCHIEELATHPEMQFNRRWECRGRPVNIKINAYSEVSMSERRWGHTLARRQKTTVTEERNHGTRQALHTAHGSPAGCRAKPTMRSKGR